MNSNLKTNNRPCSSIRNSKIYLFLGRKRIVEEKNKWSWSYNLTITFQYSFFFPQQKYLNGNNSCFLIRKHSAFLDRAASANISKNIWDISMQTIFQKNKFLKCSSCSRFFLVLREVSFLTFCLKWCGKSTPWLFSVRVTYAIHFRCCCCWRSSRGLVSVSW